MNKVDIVKPQINIRQEVNLKELALKPVDYPIFIEGGDKMNFLAKLLKFILPYIPIKLIATFFLEQFEKYVADSKTKWDDYALLALWSVLSVLGLASEPPEALKDKCKPVLDTDEKVSV